MTELAFGPAFRAARLSAGKSGAAVARMLGVTTPYVSNVEHGNRLPFSFEVIRTTARAFNMDAAETLNLLRLAIKARGVFTLPAGPTPKHLDTAVTLCLRWGTLTPQQLDQLHELLNGATGA